jgi:hypothetical protein
MTSVRVKNQTSKKILTVGVSHKYSNLFKNDKTWSNISSGETAQDPFLVKYNTGFMTTGRDWWYIFIQFDDGAIYETNPSNLRGLWDKAEKLLDKYGWAVTIAALKAAGETGPGAAVAIPVAAVAAALTVISNTETTEGFKQFFLEEKDAEPGIEIIIRDDEVEFKGIESTATTPLHKIGHVKQN